MDITIRQITTLEEMRGVEDVMRITWDSSDLEVLPAYQLHAMVMHGSGHVIGAFHDGNLIGFLYGTLGLIDTPDRIDQVAAARLQLHSSHMGFLPEYQGQGIGEQLKQRQRDIALALGIALITWTFDPLESRNAWLNIGKLGAVCNTYAPNWHGELEGVNAGLPSDRFRVKWWVTSNRAKSRAAKKRKPLQLFHYTDGNVPIINKAAFNTRNQPVPSETFDKRDNNLLLVEIPAYFQAVKRDDFELAQAWRTHTRDIFEYYFANEYLVTDVVVDTSESPRDRTFYVLTYQNA